MVLIGFRYNSLRVFDHSTTYVQNMGIEKACAIPYLRTTNSRETRASVPHRPRRLCGKPHVLWNSRLEPNTNFFDVSLRNHQVVTTLIGNLILLSGITAINHRRLADVSCSMKRRKSGFAYGCSGHSITLIDKLRSRLIVQWNEWNMTNVKHGKIQDDTKHQQNVATSAEGSKIW